MTKTELKQNAQRHLMYSMQSAFDDVEQSSEKWIEMDKQMKRVERLFGYDEGSWTRGA